MGKSGCTSAPVKSEKLSPCGVLTHHMLTDGDTTYTRAEGFNHAPVFDSTCICTRICIVVSRATSSASCFILAPVDASMAARPSRWLNFHSTDISPDLRTALMIEIDSSFDQQPIHSHSDDTLSSRLRRGLQVSSADGPFAVSSNVNPAYSCNKSPIPTKSRPLSEIAA